MTVTETFFTLSDTRHIHVAVVNPEGQIRGTAMISGGRGENIKKRRRELSTQLSAYGLRQIYFDWYGEGMSDRPLDGNKRQRCHALSFNQHVSDVAILHREFIGPQTVGPLLAFSHSFGGHAHLRWLAETSQNIPTFVTSPMETIRNAGYVRLASVVSRVAIALGKCENYARGQMDYFDNPLSLNFEGNELTHDRDRFAFTQADYRDDDRLVMGGITWGWLKAATDSIKISRTRGYLASIKAPVMVICGSEDAVVPPSETFPLLSTIPGVELHQIKGALHELTNECDIYRLPACKHIDRFVKRYMQPT